MNVHSERRTMHTVDPSEMFPISIDMVVRPTKSQADLTCK